MATQHAAAASVRGGFTLLELAVALLVIVITVTMTVAVVSKLRARAQRAQCSANLRSLYVAANDYVQEHESWPQIPLSGADEGAQRQYATAWLNALLPSGPTAKTWICPTIENLMGNPGYGTPEAIRTDYVAMTFDDKPGTAHRWPRQPWFVERADVHGHGNLMVLTDGSITDLKTVTAGQRR